MLNSLRSFSSMGSYVTLTFNLGKSLLQLLKRRQMFWSGCVSDSECAVNVLCSDAAMVGWCANHKIAEECNPQVQCTWGSGGISLEPEPETESGAASAPVVLHVPAPGPVPASGKPWTPEQEDLAYANKLPVLSTATCKNLCIALCNKHNLGYSIGINQGWDTSIAPNCQCKHSIGISIRIYFGGCVQKSHTTSLLEEHGIGYDINQPRLTMLFCFWGF